MGKRTRNSRVGEWRDDVAPLFVALHDFDLVHVLPRHGGGGGGGEDGGERKLGGFHVQGLKKRGSRWKEKCNATSKEVLRFCECVGGTKDEIYGAKFCCVVTLIKFENKTSSPSDRHNFRSPSILGTIIYCRGAVILQNRPF
jgi:hypothetical protein